MANPPQKSEVPNEIADKITLQSVMQLQASRNHKRARMEQIKESERLNLGIVEKSIRNPFNECFPYMAGFVDHLKAKIDDDSNLLYVYQAESDMKRAQKLNAFYERESKSPEAHASWNLKHRYAKTNALFSGVAIYLYYAESAPKYRSCLDVISHYDFHCEPRGGGILENHLFCGQDNLFKNHEDLLDSPSYNQDQVKKVISKYKENGYKDNDDYDHIRNNRFEALQQDPITNNYVGQQVIKLVSWYTTYKGKRYYVIFNENTSIWVRCCLLTDLFPDNLWPYITWHTNEDPDVFWSKAPADDARSIAKIINLMLNQELYNRQKSNFGETHYDTDMYPNVQALVDGRPDKHVPVDTKGGSRPISSGIFRPSQQALNGTLDLVTWLEGFTGKQLGYTSSSAGQSEADKKVGVFEGEIQQVEELIGIKNKSYRDALSHLGLLFKQGVEHNLTTPEAVKIMGAKGVEWSEITPEDLKTEQPLTIIPVGGTSEIALKRAEDQEKSETLSDPALPVNPQWRARQLLLLKKFTEEDIKDAFSQDTFAEKELMAEAAESEKMIVEGENPPLNRGADANFMQHIIDFATNTNDLTDDQYAKLMAYAMAHTDIAVENEARNIKDMIRQKRLAAMMDPNAQKVPPEETPGRPIQLTAPTPPTTPEMPAY